MKKCISIILAFLLTVQLFVPAVSAAEIDTYQTQQIQLVIDRLGISKTATLDVVVVGQELYIPAQEYSNITKCKYNLNEENLYFTLGAKTILIKLADQSLSVNFVPQPFSGILMIDGVHYLPMSEMLPWMNVTCYVDSDNVLHIDSDLKSFWEIVDDFNPIDYHYSVAEHMGSDTLSTVSLIGISVFDSLMNLDELWKKTVTVSDSKTNYYEYEIYKECFREFAIPQEITSGTEALNILDEVSDCVSDGSQYLNDWYSALYSDEYLEILEHRYEIFNSSMPDKEILEGVSLGSDILKYTKTAYTYLLLSMTNTQEYSNALNYIYLRDGVNYDNGIELAASEAILALESRSGALADGAITVLEEIGSDILKDCSEEVWDGLIGTAYADTFMGSFNLYLDVIDATLSIVWPINKAYNEISKMLVYQRIQYDALDAYYSIDQRGHALDEEDLTNARMSAIIFLKTALKCQKSQQQVLGLFSEEGVMDGIVKYYNSAIADFTLSAQSVEHDTLTEKTAEAERLLSLWNTLICDPDVPVPETEPYEPNPSQPTETPNNPADNSHLYQDAMAAYAKLLQNGIMLATDTQRSVKATHYQLLDMNGDNLPEMVVFAVEDYVPHFCIYAYQDGAAKCVGDSINTCDISMWYNASHYLHIYDGNKLFASVDKTTAAYADGVWGFLHYDGSEVKFVDDSSYGSAITEELIRNSVIVGGIQIGSDSDPLAKTETPEESQTEPEPIPEPEPEPIPETEPQTEPETEPQTEPETEPTVQFDRPGDGIYYYSILSCTPIEGVLWTRLRGSWQDYKSFFNDDSHEGMIGLTYEHNAGYEVYFVEYYMGAIYGDDNNYTIHTRSADEFDTPYRYEVDPDGYVSRYDDNGNLGTGYGLQICAFDYLALEIADNCIFADERLINSSDRIEMSMDEFMDIISQECPFVWSYVEVHVTIQDGKVSELVLPYIP